jgi:hypothetical protein
LETDLFVSIVVSGNSLCLQCFPRFPALQTQFPVSGLQELPRHSQSSLQYNPYFARGQANRAEKINKSIYRGKHCKHSELPLTTILTNKSVSKCFLVNYSYID